MIDVDEHILFASFHTKDSKRSARAVSCEYEHDARKDRQRNESSQEIPRSQLDHKLLEMDSAEEIQNFLHLSVHSYNPPN